MSLDMAPVYYRVVDTQSHQRKNVPVRGSVVTIREFMDQVANCFHIQGKFELYYHGRPLRPQEKLQALSIDSSMDTIDIVHHDCSSDLETTHPALKPVKQNNDRLLSPLHTSAQSDRDTLVRSQSLASLSESHFGFRKLDPIFRHNSSSPSTCSSITETSTHEQFTYMQKSQSTPQVSAEHEETSKMASTTDHHDSKSFHDLYPESDFEDDENFDDDEQINQLPQFSLETQSLPEPDTQIRADSGDKFRNYANANGLEGPVTKHSRPLSVRIRTVCKNYSIEIPCSIKIRDLIRIIWDKIPFEEEHFTTDSHVLLLFNHRLHIFIESNPEQLVKDFLQLSPENAQTDFYVYALPIEYRDFMYNYDDGYNQLFKDSESWNPVYFAHYKQIERPQSTLLSSLYALALYFISRNSQLANIRRTMEAQFFLQLRKYLFPPAVLALKHALEGSMFWFEKPLLMDSLIQLLIHLSPKTMKEVPIHESEIFDFIPLLFCWLLEQCDPNDDEEDCFSTVRLTNNAQDESSYFEDPVTTNQNNRQQLILEEFDSTQSYENLIHHVDLQSLNRHLTSVANQSSDLVCKCKEYEIYDPSIDKSSELKEFARWSEDEITKHYKVMSRKYPFLTIVTRGALTAEISNQLVLLKEKHTVSLLLSRENNTTQRTSQRNDINHFFNIFNPFNDSKESLIVTADTFVDEQKDWPDPRCPLYFTSNIITQPNNTPSSEINEMKPAKQVTVVLLDLSRSMFDHHVGNDNKIEKYTHIDMCKMMLGTLSDNMLPKDEGHAFGLIEFGERVEVTCPITRNRSKFEKALKSHIGVGQRTYMYDAVDEAISRIKTYVNSPLRAEEKCKKLIICLSDGINNAGSTKIKSLREKIKDNEIVIDFISFLRDDQIDEDNKKRTIEEFRKLSTDSGGYVYSNLHYRSNIEVAAMFEQEAAVWLSKRAKRSSGIVEKPVRHVNPNFQQPATRQLAHNINIQNSTRQVRIHKEFNEIQNNPSEDFLVFVVPSNIAFWKVVLKGPEKTPYENKYWVLYVEFNSNYPSCPPNVRFVTPIYHVNISGDGKICHEIFDQTWFERTKMTTVFKNIIDLLKNPNFSDAVSIEKAHLYRDDPTEYEEQVSKHAKEYAMSDIRTLKREHQLYDDGEPTEEENK